jgi:hypothetical protein
MSEKTLADLGMEVKTIETEIGVEYPIFGSITSILDDTLANFTVVLNFNFKTRMLVQSQESLDIIKDRIFENGIFLATILEKNALPEGSEDQERIVRDPKSVDKFPFEGTCRTVIYGNKKELNG